MIEFGASPRGPIGLVQAARVLALLRGRGHVAAEDIRDLAADVLRHRIVLSYDALSEGVTADELLEQVLAAVPEPGSQHLLHDELRPSRSGRREHRATCSRRRPARAPARSPQPLIEALDVAISRLVSRTLPGDRRAAGVGARHRARAAAAVRDRRRRAPHRPRRDRAHRRSRTCGCTCPSGR